MSDLSLPTNYMPTVPSATLEEIEIIKLAREIAMDIHELPQILELHGVTQQGFEKLKTNPRFIKVLASEIEAWGSAVNTHERVKLKAGAILEEWLPELYARINDPRENLLSKIKGGELVTKLAGMGLNEIKAFDPSERVTITINLGEDHKLQFDKRLPPKVIDHEPLIADTFEESLESSIQESPDVSNKL